MLPDLNEQLSNGMDIPDKIWEQLAKYDVADLLSKMFQDYIALGVKVDL
jgi:S-methylmethionine-dependent homocysteine/selenocysteine methylase